MGLSDGQYTTSANFTTYSTHFSCRNKTNSSATFGRFTPVLCVQHTRKFRILFSPIKIITSNNPTEIKVRDPMDLDLKGRRDK
jgi:hypothetical protein